MTAWLVFLVINLSHILLWKLYSSILRLIEWLWYPISTYHMGFAYHQLRHQAVLKGCDPLCTSPFMYHFETLCTTYILWRYCPFIHSSVNAVWMGINKCWSRHGFILSIVCIMRNDRHRPIWAVIFFAQIYSRFSAASQSQKYTFFPKNLTKISHFFFFFFFLERSLI